MIPKGKYIDGSEIVRFELQATVEKNFNAYQDAIAKHPESTQQLKLRYDQYLKTVPLYKQESNSEENSTIEFAVAQ